MADALGASSATQAEGALRAPLKLSGDETVSVLRLFCKAADNYRKQ